MHSKPQKVKTPQQALETLEWLSAKMERCSEDARRSLYRWGITDKEEQQKIITKLKDTNFINDSRYAGAYVRDKLINGRWGEAKIRAGLRTKFIDNETINTAIAQNIDTQKLKSRLVENIRKHHLKEKTKTENTYQLRTKLFRRAASQGFDIEDINNAIAIIINED